MFPGPEERADPETLTQIIGLGAAPAPALPQLDLFSALPTAVLAPRGSEGWSTGVGGEPGWVDSPRVRDLWGERRGGVTRGEPQTRAREQRSGGIGPLLPEQTPRGSNAA